MIMEMTKKAVLVLKTLHCCGINNNSTDVFVGSKYMFFFIENSFFIANLTDVTEKTEVFISMT